MSSEFDWHIVNQIRNPLLRNDSTLHVIRVISNPARYHSRYRLARKQEEFLKKCPNIKLYTVEAAFGDRHHEIVEQTDETHLKVYINDEIWIKENLINIGVEHLFPHDWKYMAWIDGDVIWNDENWAIEAMHQLQHYPVLQPWQDGLDLGVHGNIIGHYKSFGAQNFVEFDAALDADIHGKKRIPIVSSMTPTSSMPYDNHQRYGHSGYAWCCTRTFWENAGGLLDFCILGSGDHNMATAMAGNVDFSIHPQMTDSFKTKCREWMYRVNRVNHKIIGYTHDRLEHFFHGPKKRRYYTERWKLLIHFKFDPVKDLMYDNQGILHLVGKPDLKTAIMHYNRSRHEDSIEET
jgi:hypothetical protein